MGAVKWTGVCFFRALRLKLMDRIVSNALLEGSWVVISGVITCLGFLSQGLGFKVILSGLTCWVTKHITHTRGLITRLIATHEPPSMTQCRAALGFEFLAVLSFGEGGLWKALHTPRNN